MLTARFSLVVLLALLGLPSCGGKTVPKLPEKVVGHCEYKNGFSKAIECRDYVGDWSEADARKGCEEEKAELLPGACQSTPRLGYCIFDDKKNRFRRIVFPGDNKDKCGSFKTGCEFFGGGVFEPSSVCSGVPDDMSTGLPPFEQPTLTCQAPKNGEAPGRSANGQVCTWDAISAATELGRDFRQYGDCRKVRTQRPYYPAAIAPDGEKADPRLNDKAYADEVAWVKQQIQSTACVCCHSNSAPEGFSNWYVEQPGNFINGFYDRGLAMGAGWINSVGFGAYPQEQNNGFSRATPETPNESIFVTTDQARMKRFFENELAFRGKKRSDFPDLSYAAGPLDDQRLFRPMDCANGEGVAADGTVTWKNGRARYVYVLQADATSPGTPPNLDLPQGTLWRIDVAATASPLASGSVRYGVAPSGTTQKFPEAATATALQSGQKYYLYTLADVAVPTTRCLFVAP
jgi:catechol 2,3-dioxygenase-like lactoylglutathione lyase family enzyme